MKNVLLVDNNESFVKSLKAGLEMVSGDLILLTATSGREAVQILKSNIVDLVVTELEIPAMDGFELLNYTTTHFPFIPVIVMTGYVTEQAKSKARDLGALSFFGKPPDLKELARTIFKGLGQGPKEGFVKNISVSGFLQLISVEERTCLLSVTTENKNEKGLLFFNKGILYDAATHGIAAEKAAIKIIGWENAKIQFLNLPIKKIQKRIQTELMALLMEAARLKDEAGVEKTSPSEEPLINEQATKPFDQHTVMPKVEPAKLNPILSSKEPLDKPAVSDQKKPKKRPFVDSPKISPPKEKTSTHLLHEIVDTPGIDTAIIVARDGFVIESAGSLGAIDLDMIGAAVALSMNGIVNVGKELSLKPFQTFTWEANDALIMCTVAGDALLVVLSPDSGKIGGIRLKLNKQLPDLTKMF